MNIFIYPGTSIMILFLWYSSIKMERGRRTITCWWWCGSGWARLRLGIFHFVFRSRFLTDQQHVPKTSVSWSCHHLRNGPECLGPTGVDGCFDGGRRHDVTCWFLKSRFELLWGAWWQQATLNICKTNQSTQISSKALFYLLGSDERCLKRSHQHFYC